MFRRIDRSLLGKIAQQFGQLGDGKEFGQQPSVELFFLLGFERTEGVAANEDDPVS